MWTEIKLKMHEMCTESDLPIIYIITISATTLQPRRTVMQYVSTYDCRIRFIQLI
jgi:hypothetical protein